MGDERHCLIHFALLLSGIQKFNVVPISAPTGKIALSVKDLVAPISRYSNPG
jgi:hypothetical protein